MIKAFVARVRSIFGRRAAESRMEEEFGFHIERATEENIRAGMDASEARRLALIAFGSSEHHRESMRDTWRLVWFEDLIADARFALRWLCRSPGFAAVAILTIALGIGATTALFSATNALLLEPLPVLDPGQLHTIQEERSGYVQDGIEGMHVPHNRYEAYVAAVSGVFTDLAAHGSHGFALRADGAAMQASGVLVSGNYFRVLGVRPIHGRFFTSSDEPVVVLSHRFWQTQFGGDPAVAGRTVYLDGRPLTVAGVAAGEFTGTNVGFSIDLWVPYRAATTGGESVWADDWMTPFGRLRPGIESEQAGAILTGIARSIGVDAPGAEVQGAQLEPMTGLPSDFRPVLAGFLGLLLAMAMVVLLIAAANVAGMQLGRAVRRRREIAVRLAIGAGRGRLLRQLLTETMILFLIGGITGVLLAWLATSLFARISLPVPLPLLLEVSPDLGVLGFGLAAAALAGLVFGLLPALRTTQPELASALKEGAMTGGTHSTHGRGAFVAGQIALAVVLVAVAGLFVRTLQTALSVDPGFDPNNVLIASMDLSTAGYDEEAGRAFQSRLMERIRGMGDVESATLARVALLTGNSVAGPAAPVEAPEMSTRVRFNLVDAEYFGTMRIDLLAGRGFDTSTSGAALAPVVINQTLAQRLWPGENALGRLLRRGDADFEVVGIVRDGLYRDYSSESGAFAFFPLEHSYSPRIALHVRTQTPAAEMLERIRNEVMLLDPDIALEQAAPLTALAGVLLLPQRIGAYLVGVFGLLGLLLAGLGIYGVLSYRVAERTRELGIRMALGASAGRVVRLVIRNITYVAALGVVVGVVIAAALGQLIEGFIFGITPHDPWTFLGALVLLVGVVLVASLVPLRRAVRSDPATALRHE